MRRKTNQSQGMKQTSRLKVTGKQRGEKRFLNDTTFIPFFFFLSKLLIAAMQSFQLDSFSRLWRATKK
jgi:hypothetical protein